MGPATFTGKVFEGVCWQIVGFGVLSRLLYTHMGSDQKTLSRSLYKTTYLIVGVYLFIYNKRRHATTVRLPNPLVGARTALAWCYGSR